MTRHDVVCLAAELHCEAAMWERLGEYALADVRRATARRILQGPAARLGAVSGAVTVAGG